MPLILLMYIKILKKRKSQNLLGSPVVAFSNNNPINPKPYQKQKVFLLANFVVPFEKSVI